MKLADREIQRLATPTHPTHPTVRAGFASTDIWTPWQGDKSIQDEVGAQVAVFQPDGEAPLALIAVDVCLIWTSVCTRLRQVVARTLGSDPSRIGVFCTQNHGAPFIGEGSVAPGVLEELLATAAYTAWRRIRPAVMAYVERSPDPPLNINRRKLFGEFGAFTFFFGYDSEGAYPRCAGLLSQALQGLATGDTVSRKYPGDPPPEGCPAAIPRVDAEMAMDGVRDGLVQGLFFRDEDGAPIGAIARFSAHPAVATGLTAPPGGDYPVYVRRHLREGFGGEPVFLTGPCGNQAIAVTHKRTEKARHIGAGLAAELLAGLRSATWEPVHTCRAVTETIRLPLRTDVPASETEVETRQREAIQMLETLRAAGAPLASRKRIADRVETLGYHLGGIFHSWTGITPEDRSSGQREQPFFALRLNDVAVAGLPGEPMAEYSLALRRLCRECSLIVAEECNGYVSYIPTAEEHRQGGYEVCASIFAPETEQVLIKGVGAMIGRLWPLSGDFLTPAIRRLGVRRGDTIMAHASLSSLGYVEGGATTVLTSLLNAVGERGTLVMPTFGDFFRGGPEQVWDRQHTPSRMGSISEAMRTWPGSRRSGHAPHPINAIGPMAADLTERANVSDFAPDSPFQALVDQNAWIILLGVDFHACTLLHLLEERFLVPYRQWTDRAGAVIDNGVRRQKVYRFYDRLPGCVNDFMTCGRDLAEAGLVAVAHVGRACVRAVRARALYDFVAARITQNPNYLLAHTRSHRAGPQLQQPKNQN